MLTPQASTHAKEPADDICELRSRLRRIYGQTNVSGNAMTHQGDQIFTGPVQMTSRESRFSPGIAASVLLESLSFEARDSRFQDISVAHRNTFLWALKAHDDPLSPYGAFHTWLREPQSPLFWIKGKPGVGKSTLMRLLASSALTRQCLAERIGKLRLVIAKCFLWNPGPNHQSSLSGLLRSLLYEVLIQCTELCPAACSRRWGMIEAGLDLD